MLYELEENFSSLSAPLYCLSPWAYRIIRRGKFPLKSERFIYLPGLIFAPRKTKLTANQRADNLLCPSWNLPVYLPRHIVIA